MSSLTQEFPLAGGCQGSGLYEVTSIAAVAYRNESGAEVYMTAAGSALELVETGELLCFLKKRFAGKSSGG